MNTLEPISSLPAGPSELRVPGHRAKGTGTGSWVFASVLSFGLLLSPLDATPFAPSPASAQDTDVPEAKSTGKRKKKRRGARDKARRAKEPASEVTVPGPSDAPAEQAQPSDAAPAQSATAPGGSLRRSNKMEFDARLVRGETAGTGAVVLFDRGQRELPPLTSERRGFLAPTIQEVYGDRAPTPASRTVSSAGRSPGAQTEQGRSKPSKTPASESSSAAPEAATDASGETKE